MSKTNEDQIQAEEFFRSNNVNPYFVRAPVNLDNIEISVSISSGCNHDLKWYDSGFTKFQYCSKCNKEFK